MAISPQTLLAFLLASIALAACSGIDLSLIGLRPDEAAAADACPVTQPEFVVPPEDPAVGGTPAPGYYFVNQDRSIWASAGWTEYEEYRQAGGEGVKVGWFRPAGAALEVSGRRIDGEAPPLHSDFPCCYPTRFQASGLYFPTEGCWEVNARAITDVGAIRESPLLTFVVKIDP
ncbi:MAG TPA: hypothetical protein VJ768_01800 [Anaerolineales bacterium]|nr:hypothetical protein [Anaerolineales bacterium]